MGTMHKIVRNLLLAVLLTLTGGEAGAKTIWRGTLKTHQGLPWMQLEIQNPGPSPYQLEVPAGFSFVPEDGTNNVAFSILPFSVRAAPGSTATINTPVLLKGNPRPGIWAPGYRGRYTVLFRVLTQANQMSQAQRLKPEAQSAMVHLAWLGVQNQGNLDESVLARVRPAVEPSQLERIASGARKLMEMTGWDVQGLSREAEVIRLLDQIERLLTDKRPAEALPLAERAVSLDEAGPLRTRFALARTLFIMGRFAEGEREFTRCMQLYAKDPGYRHFRALCRQDQKNYWGAMQDFDVLLRLWPNQARSYAGRGLLKQELGDDQGAQADFYAAARLDKVFQPLLNERLASGENPASGPVASPHGQPLQVGSDRIQAGQVLATGEQLRSPNQRYRLSMQHDGNCVLYGPTQALWNTKTQGRNCRLYLGGNGQIRLLDSQNRILWQSGPFEPGQYYLQVQDDGNLVLYRQETQGVRPVWATQTSHK